MAEAVNPEIDQLNSTDSLIPVVQVLFGASNRGVVNAVGQFLRRSPGTLDQMNLRLIAAAAPFLDDGHLVAMVEHLPLTEIDIALEPLDLDLTRSQFKSVFDRVGDPTVRAKLVHNLVHSSTDRLLELMPYRNLTEDMKSRVEQSLFQRIKTGDLSDARFVIERQPITERILALAGRRFRHDPKVTKFVLQQRLIAERTTKPFIKLLRLVDAQYDGKHVINRIDRSQIEKQTDALIDNVARAVRNPERHFGLRLFAVDQLTETVDALGDGIAMPPLAGLRAWSQLPNNSDRLVDYSPDVLQLAATTVQGLKVHLPANIRELRSAARSMHNCLGDYAEAVAFGAQVVVGLFGEADERPEIAALWRVLPTGRFELAEVAPRHNRVVDLPDGFEKELETATAALNNELFGPINERARAKAPAQFFGI